MSAFLSKGKRLEMAALAGMLLAMAAMRMPGIRSRAIDYREAMTLLETSGHMDPVWPAEPTPVAASKKQLQGASIEGRRSWDHPWLYSWVLTKWRGWTGDSIEWVRGFSLPFSLAAVLLLYGLLRSAQFPYPLVPVWFFGLTMGSVHQGQEATDYAFASVPAGLVTLFAWLTSRARSRQHLWGYALATGTCAAVAFNTNYISIFPVGATLLWYLIGVWRTSRLAAILPSLLAGAGAAAAVAERYYSGLVGPPDTAVTVLRAVMLFVTMNTQVLYTPVYLGVAGSLAAWLMLVAMLVYSLLAIRRHGFASDRSLLALMGLVAVSSSAGIFVLNAGFNRHYMEPRYLLFSTPAVAVLVSYGLVRLLAVRRGWGLSLLVVVTAVQLTGVNWGLEKAPIFFPGSRMRSLAQAAHGAPGSKIVAVAAGKGRGIPATVAYELDPSTVWLVFDDKADPDRLFSTLERYQQVFVVSSFEKRTAPVEGGLRERLRRQGWNSEQPSGEEWELWQRPRT